MRAVENVSLTEKKVSKAYAVYKPKRAVDRAYTTAAHLQLLYGIIKIAPADKERIYQQALKTLASVETAYPLGSAESISATYNSVAKALYDAEMDDRATEIARNGIALIDEVNAQTIFRAKYPVWLRLGQIYLRRNDLKKAESYFKQSIAGDSDGNAALLCLAEIAGKCREDKLQFDYLVRADTRGRLNKEQRAALETLYAKRHGSTAGLRALLDENYKHENPLPFTVVKYSPTAKRSKRTVLAELFAGAECHPCVTADTTFEALLQRYNSAEVAVLIYDLHIPGPDPLANPASIARAKFYKIGNAPIYIINGTERDGGGGAKRKLSKVFYDAITLKIDAQLERESEADLKLSAAIENNSIKTVADFANVKGDYSNLRLYVALVENEISYSTRRMR